MKVLCYDSEFDVPESLIDKFIKDFECLPGSGNRESVLQLRSAIDDILDMVAEEPEILHEKEYMSDFVRALAIQEAMATLGLLHDA
jgi:hypothetical protein